MRGELRRTKRLARNFKGAKAATVVGSRNPEDVRKIVVYVDNEWAGYKTSRMSTTEWMLIVEGCS